MSGKLPFVQLLSTNGDGTGVTNMIGNYAAGAETFELAGPSGSDTMAVERILLYVRDTGSFDTGDYGNGITLTNGMDLSVQDADDNVVIQLTPSPIITSGDWAALCHDVTQASWGIGDEFMTARWTFSKFVENGLWLNNGLRLVLTLNDDFSGLIEHRVTAQGYYTSQFY